MLADELDALLRDHPGSSTAELAELASASGVRTDERTVVRTLFAAHGRFRTHGAEPRRWWVVTGRPDDERVAGSFGPADGHAARARPAFERPLYEWQTEALRAWAHRGHRGVVEAVTGAGKTMVGIAAVLEQRAGRGQALVVVPTRELQQQWVGLLDRMTPRGTRVGALGNGARASLISHDVVVAIVNSVRSGDARPIRPDGLLVADECHRYGSEFNRHALDPRLTRRLGLSATYARDDDGHARWLDPYFGGTCYELDYRRATADGVIARPAIALVGVRFDPDERLAYDEETTVIRAAAARLVERHGLSREPYALFMRQVAALAGRGDDSEASRTARRYRAAVLERRRLLADARAKPKLLAELVPAIAAADRTLVLTASIEASEAAAAVVARSGIAARAVHSGLAADDRRERLARFASGELRVLTAPRVLDEGVDVPAADLAIIIGASRSRRQMVQRMGRLLRLKEDGRLARFAVLYVEGTVEDPASGAHEGFLEQITAIAVAERRFDTDTPASVVNDFLGVTDPTAHQPSS